MMRMNSALQSGCSLLWNNEPATLDKLRQWAASHSTLPT